MKPNRNELLSDHLLNVDEELLTAAYDIDTPDKLKAYCQSETAPAAIPFHRRKAMWVPIVAAAACVALTVGLWQGGVFDPAEIPVEAPNEGTSATTVNTTVPADTTDTTDTTTEQNVGDVVTDPVTDPATTTEQTDGDSVTATTTHSNENTTTEGEHPIILPTTNDTTTSHKEDATTAPTAKPTTNTQHGGDSTVTKPTAVTTETTDGGAVTTKPTNTSSTKKPTTASGTTPAKPTAEKTTAKPTTGKTEPTTTTTTGKTKPTTKPTTKTEPTKTTATKTDPTTQTTKIDVSEWPVIVADAPEDFGDTGNMPLIRGIISPALEKKMSLYAGEDVLYSVIVEIIGTGDAEAEFWQSYKDLAELRKKYDDALVAYEEEAKRLNPDYPNQETTVWSDKMRECLEYRRTLYDEMRTLENKYRPLFIEKKRDEKIEWLRHAVASEITPLTTDTRYYPFFSHNQESAFFATLTADEIHTLLNHHCYVIRLRHPDGDKEVDFPE